MEERRKKEERKEEEREKALLVGVDTGQEDDFPRSMKELGELAKACNMTVAGVVTQKMAAVNKAYYIGAGKVKEVTEYAKALEADIILFDNSLTPSQLRNLQKETGKPVLDRTALILDIFSLRAKTREAKLQVETARLQYLMSRLVGMHDALTRQGGTSGSMSSRGAGEKKLELDRRKIEHRLSELGRELEEVAKERETQGKKRQESRIPKVSLVGYTNAGKSTLMNRMLETYGTCPGGEEKKVLEKDMLFATLDTTVRNISFGNGREILLSDTVGFIHKLPHGLVKAFRSTLEEVKNADLLLCVVDCSDENHKQQMKVTEETLLEIGAADIPKIIVYNKADLCRENAEAAETDNESRNGRDLGMGSVRLPEVIGADKIYLSAKSGEGMEELAQMIQNKVFAGYMRTRFLFPYEKGQAVSWLMEHAAVHAREYTEQGIAVIADCHKADVGKYREYVVGVSKQNGIGSHRLRAPSSGTHAASD